MDNGDYIIFNRNILKETWFKEPYTKTVFLHLLLKANMKKTVFRDTEVPEGAFVTTYVRLSDELNIKVCEVEKTVKHIANNGKIKVNRYSKNLVIAVNNFFEYVDVE